MLFNSVEFFIFFPIVTILYFLLPHKYRWFHLLAASCIFYMYFVPIYIVILFGTIVVDYIAGILIENASGARRKYFLTLSLFANIGVLAVFKYYNFFIENIDELLLMVGLKNHIPYLSMILPIGLSFHTFQAMSYTIEIYRGNQKAERHFGIYSLYVMFYPQLVAGPIERPQNMLHQFHEPHKLEYDNVAAGMRTMLWGLVKKIVIADRLSLYTTDVFNHAHDQSATALIIATIFFAFQIFCDFSGYSDIAIGAAQVMGFKLMTNFNKPYSATNLADFWRKWHISLSTWLSDYLFNPIAVGLRDRGLYALVIASITTFVVSGLWHGAAWTYIIWGALHGIGLSYELLTKKNRKKMFKKMSPWVARRVGIICTFSFVCFSYIFFRANNVRDAFFIVRKTLSFPSELMEIVKTHRIAFLHLPNIFTQIVPGIMVIAFLEVAHIVQIKMDLENTFSRKPLYVRWAVYYAAFFLLAFCGVFEKSNFIYYQF